MMLHRYLEAADDCAAALKIDPTATKLHARRGRALLRLGNFAQADESFQVRPWLLFTSPFVPVPSHMRVPPCLADALLQRVLETSAKQDDKELEVAKTDARYAPHAHSLARPGRLCAVVALCHVVFCRDVLCIPATVPYSL
jgi:hypothetical protein